MSHPAQLAQMAEHETFNLRVVGSTPALGNTFSSTTHFLPKFKDKMNHRPVIHLPGYIEVIHIKNQLNYELKSRYTTKNHDRNLLLCTKRVMQYNDSLIFFLIYPALA